MAIEISESTVDRWLDAFEAGATEFEGKDDFNVRVLDAIRTELGGLGMSKTYRDRFAAMATVEIGVDLTEKQEQRILGLAAKIVRNVYETYSELGYSDDAIAWMGHRFQLTLRET